MKRFLINSGSVRLPGALLSSVSLSHEIPLQRSFSSTCFIPSYRDAGESTRVNRIPHNCEGVVPLFSRTVPLLQGFGSGNRRGYGGGNGSGGGYGNNQNGQGYGGDGNRRGGRNGNGSFRGGNGGGNGAGARSSGDGRPIFQNTTGDGELSPETRAAMRDEAIIVGHILKTIPPNGAISLKALNSSLPEEIQEALSEKHSGLSSFLRERQQLFIVKPRPEDQVLFVAGNPIAIQKYASREVQKKTMRNMMGLDNDNRRGGRGGGFRGGGGRGGGYGGRGGGGSYGGGPRRGGGGMGSGARQFGSGR